MARTAKITLDGSEYLIHAFNVKELREVGGIIENGANLIDKGMNIVAVAMRRAEPKVDFEALEPEMPEVNRATEVILSLSGIDIKNPPAAAPAEN